MSVYIGDVGTRIEITITKDDGSILNLQGASVKNIKFKQFQTVTKTATFVTDGTDGKLQYTIIDGDTVFNKAGSWKIQAYVELPGSGKWSSDVTSVVVEDNL